MHGIVSARNDSHAGDIEKLKTHESKEVSKVNEIIEIIKTKDNASNFEIETFNQNYLMKFSDD